MRRDRLTKTFCKVPERDFFEKTLGCFSRPVFLMSRHERGDE